MTVETRSPDGAFVSHTHLRLVTPEGEIAARLAPALQVRTDPVVVGDWVAWRPGVRRPAVRAGARAAAA